MRVSGSEFLRDPEYTIKLEGVRRVGYSTILMGGVRDPYILAQFDSWLAQLDDNIKTRIRNTVGERAYEIVTRVCGRDGVMSALEPQRGSVGGRLRRYPGGTENASILATVRGSIPKRRAASRWLIPSI